MADMMIGNANMLGQVGMVLFGLMGLIGLVVPHHYLPGASKEDLSADQSIELRGFGFVFIVIALIALFREGFEMVYYAVGAGLFVVTIWKIIGRLFLGGKSATTMGIIIDAVVAFLLLSPTIFQPGMMGM